MRMKNNQEDEEKIKINNFINKNGNDQDESKPIEIHPEHDKILNSKIFKITDNGK